MTLTVLCTRVSAFVIKLLSHGFVCLSPESCRAGSVPGTVHMGGLILVPIPLLQEEGMCSVARPCVFLRSHSQQLGGCGSAGLE